ncbi:MAG: hypothetical protein PHX60_13520 [Giesbergeria sp.]|uniref:hypothetical protein n=1 Tax=Giesbergeria sp. TaxID=2818473 RepID=UPI0026319789|nr:hypothetical protein [Giesbergeria sp.]MDD2610679.1 hypothetical protein [Giesbergeria sp.]
MKIRPNRLALSTLLAIAAITALPAQAQDVTCYTVRDSTGKIIDQAADPPVDLSKRISETVPQKYGAGSTMMIGLSDFSSCNNNTNTATETNGFSGYAASNLGTNSGQNYSSGGSYTRGSSHRSSYDIGPTASNTYIGGSTGGGHTYVKGHYRSNGTYVQPYMRSSGNYGRSSGGGGRKR